MFFKKLFKIKKFMFLDRFDVLILKIILKKIKKNYFDIFPSKKHFEK
jgi:hypothetical protein